MLKPFFQILATLVIPAAHAEYKFSINNLVAKNNDLTGLQSFNDTYNQFCEKWTFDPILAWQRFVTTYGKDDPLAVSKNLTQELKSAFRLIRSRLPTNRKLSLQVLILAGCKKTDATALQAKNMVYVFFDIYKLFDQNRQHNLLRVFIIHELLHGIQIAQRPEFHPANYETAKDRLMKYIVYEGAATYFSQKLTEATDGETYWVGILSDEEYKRWLEFTRSEKTRFRNRVIAYLRNPNSQPALLSDLFYVLTPSNLKRRRAGYLYGAEILKTFDRKSDKGMDFAYSEIEPQILKYFEIPD